MKKLKGNVLTFITDTSLETSIKGVVALVIWGAVLKRETRTMKSFTSINTRNLPSSKQKSF